MSEEARRGDAEIERQGEPESVSAAPRRRVAASPRRLFCAVELPTELRARAAAHIAQLREKMPDARAGWEREEKLHLTLKFYGDVALPRTDALSQAIERAANRVKSFPLAIAEAGAFPLRGAARVLWLGVRDATGNLARLHQALEEECAAAEFPREPRPFHPHLTIARLRTPGGARTLAGLHRELGFAAMEFAVNELVLMRSELGPKGSCYTALARHRLAV